MKQNDPESALNIKFVKMAKLMNIYLNHFPKHEKYGLCQQIRNCMYDLYGLIVETQKRHHKKTAITNMNIKHEQLRMLVLLAHKLGYFEFKDGKRLINGYITKAEKRHRAINGLIDEQQAIEYKNKIELFLRNKLRLELSRWTIAPRSRSVNFVGYRTWVSKRFIRKHSIFKFKRFIKQLKLNSIISILGHARRTHSLQHLLTIVRNLNHELYSLLPESYRRLHYAYS